MNVFSDTTLSRANASMCANSPGHFGVAMMVELPPMHRLYNPVLTYARFFCDFT
jgi:hypothetical protein